VNRTDRERRVLVLAPTGRDAISTERILREAALNCGICRDIDELCAEMDANVGAVLITEEALTTERCSRLCESLNRQPPWSDIPFVVLTRGGPDSPAALRAMQTLGNVILLERPVRVSTCVTAIVTALRARDRQYLMRRHLEQMRESEQRKDEFLAMLAHELRNPLAPIRNATDILDKVAGSDPTLRFVAEIIDRQTAALSRLVDDLLDVSRITRGKVTLLREPVAVSTVIHRAAEISRSLIEAKGQHLLLDLTPMPVCVDGDITRLTQVVANLLNNASKFTPAGGEIRLRTVCADRSVLIGVRDNGIGIPRHMLGRVFDLFVQGDASLDRSHGGLGIGLTLVRKLVELHGGRVTADSAGPGLGSDFVVSLPRCEPAEEEQVQRDRNNRSSRPSRRVLVVDDNVDAAESLAVLLRAGGHEVRTAHEAESALAMIDDFAPEVCVLDIGLPDINGYELARRIREEHRGPLLVALTGYGHARNRERGRDAGFDHYLVKPLSIDRLEELMEQMAPPPYAGPVVTQAAMS
jgi:signal transduction histidine kinase/CheY-like chemotaxis protein